MAQTPKGRSRSRKGVGKQLKIFKNHLAGVLQFQGTGLVQLGRGAKRKKVPDLAKSMDKLWYSGETMRRRSHGEQAIGKSIRGRALKQRKSGTLKDSSRDSYASQGEQRCPQLESTGKECRKTTFGRASRQGSQSKNFGGITEKARKGKKK